MFTLATGWFTPAQTAGDPTLPVMLMPAGILWDAVRTPLALGMPVLERLLADPDDAPQVGPVLYDGERGLLYWLVQAGATDTYPEPARLLAAGWWIVTPALMYDRSRTARWIHLPCERVLTGPAWLAAALGDQPMFTAA